MVTSYAESCTGMSNRKFILITISLFTMWTLFVYFSLRRSDDDSLNDRMGIKTEQLNSKRERAENRAHIVRLEGEVSRLQKALEDNRSIMKRLVEYLEKRP